MNKIQKHTTQKPNAETSDPWISFTLKKITERYLNYLFWLQIQSHQPWSPVSPEASTEDLETCRTSRSGIFRRHRIHRTGYRAGCLWPSSYFLCCSWTWTTRIVELRFAARAGAENPICPGAANSSSSFASTARADPLTNPGCSCETHVASRPHNKAIPF